jgi:hypothetical protein
LLTQSPEQQISGPAQPRPSCWQLPPPEAMASPVDEPGTQPPLEHVSPLQQSLGPVHDPPFWEQPQ